MIIVGTAGHIDHGKSAIVKRLTGYDPDRLPEEKARGMTIDLGFAFMKTDSGDDIGFVDVPGHERFVRNMIAGVGGIDMVMLVIAADDGWMPQSEEHFQILRLLGIKDGIILINKCDLAEPDWLQLLEEEIRDKISGSFLSESPMFQISAITGDGFEELTSYLKKLDATKAHHSNIGKSRLAIDRSFIQQGIGKVVAGTLRGGSLSVGQAVTVWPGNHKSKVRTLQSNSLDVTQATPGQRTAVSVTGLDKDFLIRGGVISNRDDLTYFIDRSVMAFALELLANAPVSIKDRRRALVICGTTETEGELRLMNTKEIKPGGKGIAFFKPDTPLYALIGDHCILRLPTPMVTLGGAVVLDHLESFPRKKELENLSYLCDRDPSDLSALIKNELESKLAVSPENLLENSNYSVDEIKRVALELKKLKQISLSGRNYILSSVLEKVAESLVKKIEQHLNERPNLKGLSVEEIARLSHRPKEICLVLLDHLIRIELVERTNDRYDLPGRGLDLGKDLIKIYKEMSSALNDSPFQPPKLTDLAKGGKKHREVIKFLIESGEVYKCGTEFLFLSKDWVEIISYIKTKLNENNALTVADLRDKFEFSRKYAIPILEETDRLRITSRDGDQRIKGSKFEKE